MTVKITLLWGLPGSGKTTWAKETEKTENESAYYGRDNSCIIIDLDRFRKYDENDVLKHVQNCASNLYSYSRKKTDKHLIIDGLITTNEIAGKILSAAINGVDKDVKTVINIVWWTPNRKSCIFNDRNRRSQNSETTIKNMSFEEPSDVLLERFNIKKYNVSRKEVVKKSKLQLFCDMVIGSREEGFLRSSSWCLGGTWGSCWGTSGNISAEAQPATFKEFDELIEKINPNITFMQYKKLYGETVSVTTYTENDYYGGSVEHAYFKCDLKVLFKLLNKMDVEITDEILDKISKDLDVEC